MDFKINTTKTVNNSNTSWSSKKSYKYGLSGAVLLLGAYTAVDMYISKRNFARNISLMEKSIDSHAFDLISEALKKLGYKTRSKLSKMFVKNIDEAKQSPKASFDLYNRCVQKYQKTKDMKAESWLLYCD